MLTVKRDTQKERTTKSRNSWGAKAVRVRATGSPRAHPLEVVLWAFLLTVKRDTGVLLILCTYCTGKKTPGGAGTHTGVPTGTGSKTPAAAGNVKRHRGEPGHSRYRTGEKTTGAHTVHTHDYMYTKEPPIQALTPVRIGPTNARTR